MKTTKPVPVKTNDPRPIVIREDGSVGRAPANPETTSTSERRN